MNKKFLALAAAAALTFSMAGCMPAPGNVDKNGSSSTEEQTPDPSQDQQETQKPAENPFGQNKTDPETETPKVIEMKVMVEGTEQTVQATVYTGGAYTIAIPKDWERNVNEPQWSPLANDGVELTIRFYTGEKADKVAELFQKSEEDCTFEAPEKAALANVPEAMMLRGSKMDDGEMTELVAYFIDTGAGCYGILMECPLEAAEGFGAYLAAMADSFTLTQTTPVKK